MADTVMTRLTETHLSQATASRQVSEADAIAVLRLRHWHHLLNEMLKLRQFKIPIHLAFGHEAAAVAMDRSMERDDRQWTSRVCAPASGSSTFPRRERSSRT